MKRSKKITRKTLINCYDDETYQMCKSISRQSTFKWLKEANKFFLKIKGIDAILRDEKILREIGW